MKQPRVIRKTELNHMSYGQRRVFAQTLALYRSACGYIGNVVLAHWDSLEALPSAKKRINAVEALIHKTTDNPDPEHPDFDRLYYKFPSYLRRAAISYAIGQVSSYQTRLAAWEEEKHAAMSAGKRFRKKPPRLSFETNAFPVLYRGQSYKQDGRRVQIKVFIRRTWDWVTVGMPQRDLRSLIKAAADPSLGKMESPTLVYAYHRYCLYFPFQVKTGKFGELPPDEQIILGVDLGINHGAVCSAVDAWGSVHSRAFDPFEKERRAIGCVLTRIRVIQKKSGPQRLSRLYTKLACLKDNYVRQLARWIVNQAVSAHAYGIVLEHLGRMKGRGRHRDRIHHWCKCRIRDFVKSMALRAHIRVFLINPRNTSALAYDGSGKVIRDMSDFSKCTFQTGKRYDCDLSASYNIAARYFLRAMEKSMSSEAWTRLRAEIPELGKRTACTLSTLWKLAEVS